MNRTQRAMIKASRELENGRASFKGIYLRGSETFGGSVNSHMMKQMQTEMKEYRSQTREMKKKFRTEHSRQNTSKEVLEV